MSVASDPQRPEVGSTPANVRAASASRLAAEACTQAKSARPVALFASVAYLHTDRETVVALTGGNVPLGPLSIRLALEAPDFPGWLSVESSIVFEPGIIRAGPAIISTTGISLWDPRPAWSVVRSNPTALDRELPALAEALSGAAPQGSLASLLDPGQSRQGVGEIGGQILAETGLRASEFVDTLRHSVSTGEVDVVRLAAARLSGLGGGFTPAGDDFLAGAMYASWSTLTAEAARSICEAIVEGATPGTTTVSAAYLRAAAAGAASESWHDLLDAIVPGDTACVRRAVERLCAVGHTSGADALAGFVQARRGLARPKDTEGE